MSSTTIDLLSLGSVITDVFSYLAPADQHELRSTTSELAKWFDNAAENGALPFYVHAPEGARWKTSPLHPRTAETPDTVTANVRNYYFSTMNSYYAIPENKVDKPTLPEGTDEYSCNDVVVHDFILQGLKCNKLFVTGMNGIKSIAKRFCEKVTATEITFDGANQLETVSMHWMLRCPNLKKVTFEGAFPKLTLVSNCWMAYCPNLETVDFKGITALKRVDDRMLFNSPNVTNIDFTPFANTFEYTGDCFIGYLNKVENLDAKLAVLQKLTRIGNLGQFAPAALREFAKGKEVKFGTETKE